jgi:signal transduction histidine kinase
VVSPWVDGIILGSDDATPAGPYRRIVDRRLASTLRAATPWLVGASLALIALDWTGPGQSLRLAAALVTSLTLGVLMHWRERRPEVTAAAAMVLSAGYLLLVPEAVIPIAGLVAVWALARTRPPRRSLFGLAGLLAACCVNLVVTNVEDTLFTMAIAGCVWALGEASRSRRAAIHEAALRAVREEQARIARELHDVIAHSVTVMVVQAAAAGDVFDDRPDRARAALATIEDVGRDTLGELRRLLGGVRDDTTSTPQAGLARVAELAAPLRSAGLEVELVAIGEPDAVPAGVDVSGYRIVQEALTNTLRHARATTARVTVRYGTDAIEIDVVDDGRGPARAPTGGYGLVGMRERAALLGGTLDAGPTSHGGFRVRARLPLAVPS